MIKKPSLRVLVLLIVVTAIGAIGCCGAVGFGIGLFYTQRQMAQIVLSAQAREDSRKLEIDNVRLEVANEWRGKLERATTADAQQQQDIHDLKTQNDILIHSLDKLAKSSERRAQVGMQMKNKIDTLAQKVDQVSDATPGVKKPTNDINKKIEDANRSLK